MPRSFFLLPSPPQLPSQKEEKTEEIKKEILDCLETSPRKAKEGDARWRGALSM